MKRISFSVILFLFYCVCTQAQSFWNSNESITAQKDFYAGGGISIIQMINGNESFNVSSDFGIIINRFLSIGVSSWIIKTLKPDSSYSFNIHPYFRLCTSFPKMFPCFFVDIGFDFRRKTYYDATYIPGTFGDFGLRPGLIINLGPIGILMRIPFIGLSWSKEEDISDFGFRFLRGERGDLAVYLYYFF